MPCVSSVLLVLPLPVNSTLCVLSSIAGLVAEIRTNRSDGARRALHLMVEVFLIVFSCYNCMLLSPLLSYLPICCGVWSCGFFFEEQGRFFSIWHRMNVSERCIVYHTAPSGYIHFTREQWRLHHPTSWRTLCCVHYLGRAPESGARYIHAAQRRVRCLG